MSLPNQIVDSLLNGAGSALLNGELVRVISNKTIGRATAVSAVGVSAFIGAVACSGNIANGGRANVVLSGVTPVRMQTGLTLAAGDLIYISGTVAGSGTNVAPGSNAAAIGVIKDTTGYSVSNPLVLADIGNLAAIASSSPTPPNCCLDLHLFYALDYDGGSDANAGFSDISLAAAGAAPKKTWEGLQAIIPTDGQGTTITIGIKPRASGATYLKQDGVTDADLDLRALQNYAAINVVASTDWSQSPEDIINSGGIIAPSCTGPNGDGSWTVTATASQEIDVGVALPTDIQARGFRVRGYANGVPGTTLYVSGVKRISGLALFTMDTGTPSLGAGDRFVIEQPGVAFNHVYWWGSTTGPLNEDVAAPYTITTAPMLFIRGVRTVSGGFSPSEFTGGDVTVEFCDFASVHTRCAYLVSQALDTGLGLVARSSDIAIGADVIDMDASALLGTTNNVQAGSFFFSNSLTAASRLQSTVRCFLDRIRFTSSVSDTIIFRDLSQSRSERYNGGKFIYVSNGGHLFISQVFGASGSTYLFDLRNLRYTFVEIFQITLPAGYTVFATAPGGSWNTFADFQTATLYGQNDPMHNIYPTSTSQSVVRQYQSIGTVKAYVPTVEVGPGDIPIARIVRLTQGAVARQIVQALADTVPHARVVGVTMTTWDPVGPAGTNDSTLVVSTGRVWLDFDAALADVDYGKPVWLSNAATGKGTLTKPGNATLIGYLMDLTAGATSGGVDLFIRTSE